MGHCYFIVDSYEGPRLEEVRSEDLLDWLEENGNRVLNTTLGIWFYERDLFDRKKLKRELKNLIKEIDKIR